MSQLTSEIPWFWFCLNHGLTMTLWCRSANGSADLPTRYPKASLAAAAESRSANGSADLLMRHCHMVDLVQILDIDQQLLCSSAALKSRADRVSIVL